MKNFMDKDFMLQSKTAERLFHDYAKELPIIDYHCHLSPKEIWEDIRFGNITEAWLGGDHYKWRIMRSNGVDEDYITGSKAPREKFDKFVEALQYAPGNPIYHWTHLELQRYFDIYEPLTIQTANDIWDKTNSVIAHPESSARQFIKKFNVMAVCTTDDPTDTLEYHANIKNEGKMECKVLPTFRPDKAVDIHKPTYLEYIESLTAVWGKSINTYADLLDALKSRVEFFNEAGCRLADHGVEYCPFAPTDFDRAQEAFNAKKAGNELTYQQDMEYKTHLMQFLGELYNKHGWTLQIHMGAIRNNNTRMFEKLGPDTGFDSIHDNQIAYNLSRFLDSLEQKDCLPKTILYTLNPKDNYVLGTMLGNFQGSGIPGKIQFGSGWWFNDQRDGMVEQMKTLANLGLLGRFVGMLTDSRSFLSYPRHEYFRRIMCNLLGEWVEKGELPNDIDWLGGLVQGISYYNAEGYFGI